MIVPTTLDGWLSAIYKADMCGQKDSVLEQFSTVLGLSPSLTTEARARLVELNTMIDARGELACSFSTRYRNYLAAVLS